MNRCFKTVVTACLSVCIAAGISFAADMKAPDAKAAAKAPAADGKKAVADSKTVPAAKIIDINSATEAELKSVPGIGDSYASKIIAGRPYANKTQLKTRNILPAPVYEKTKDLLIAKQAKAETKAAPAKKK